MALIHYSNCPVCASRDIHPLLTVKDHMVSKESFVIWQCNHCSLRFTQDVPDQSSIAPYYKSEDYISHTDTSKGIVNKLYQKVRIFTLRQKASLVKKTVGVDKGRILDMGCGTGAFLHTMKNAGWDIEGIEPDEDAKKIASDLHGVNPKQPGALFEFSPCLFDAITLWHVLEHVHDLHDYMAQLKTILKASGKIFIAVPNYTSADASAYRLKWAAYDVPRHLYHFSPASMETLCSKHGLRIVEKKPMWFDSFYISMLSSKYKNGHTNLLGAGITGLRSNLVALMNKDRCSSLVYVIEKDRQA